MKFFKHFADARTRTGMQVLMRKFGKHKAYACYFILVEMCTAKWDDKEPGWEACEFRFSLQHMSQELGTKPEGTLILLASYAEQDFLNYEHKDQVVKIKFHKLLKFLDKDSKYNRKFFANGSHKTTLDKEEDKEKDKEHRHVNAGAVCFFSFERAYKEYPRKEGRGSAEKIYNRLLASGENFEKLSKAIENYRSYLEEHKIQTRYIKHFSNFLENWKEWVEPKSESFEEKIDWSQYSSSKDDSC